ncbi:DUF2306 domain-containing protein [Pleionea sp. CnH1-48]|uniref:DUF2306 domain-containing protein n=1 Tax=Pleionea sp. CnH1-48 TaxID=2954494 RepID=UPI002097143C|nr:DUF2306 domain-containing protein [Pleionea sp. CnH1-48]MCO7224168.1 DUF2306 domain-containing protein [Pleionea sp. CnH1-48]
MLMYIRQMPKYLFLLALITGPLVLSYYITALYGTHWLNGHLKQWNLVLENLYVEQQLIANLAMGLHLFGGMLLGLAGPIQLSSWLRKSYPYLHKMNGRLYVMIAIMVSFGGLTFIGLRGTVGGFWMDVGFGLYGVCLLTAAGCTGFFAYQRQFQRHRRWAIRLFLLGISSWLYRVEYSLWAFVNDGLVGHDSETWQGSFDRVMNFAFYIPTLIAGELYLHWRQRFRRHTLLGVLMVFIAVALMAGTFFALMGWWLPAIHHK